MKATAVRGDATGQVAAACTVHEDLELPGRVMATARALERHSMLVDHRLDADDIFGAVQSVCPLIDRDELRQISAKVAHGVLDGRLRGRLEGRKAGSA